jgi:hypothetical protein
MNSGNRIAPDDPAPVWKFHETETVILLAAAIHAST